MVSCLVLSVTLLLFEELFEWRMGIDRRHSFRRREKHREWGAASKKMRFDKVAKNADFLVAVSGQMLAVNLRGNWRIADRNAILNMMGICS
jgi:hypothetical protein